MFNIRPDKRWFEFGDGPLEEPPGFRMNADGTVRDVAPGDLWSAFPGIDPGDAAALPAGTMFNVQPGQNLPGLHNFKPPQEQMPGFRMNADGSIRDASAPPVPVYPDVGANPFRSFDQPDAKAFTAVGDGSLPPYLAYSPELMNGLGRLPTRDEGEPGGTWPSPISNSPFLPRNGTSGQPFVAPLSPFAPGVPDPSDVLHPSSTSLSYTANPPAMSGLSFAGPRPGEGFRADGHSADAAAPDEGPPAGQGADPNIVLARVVNGEQVAQATPPAGSRGGSPANPAATLPPGRTYGVVPQVVIERGMTELQKKINRDQAFRELTRQPLTADEARNALPDDWESTKPADLVDEIKRAAERHGVPVQLLARLLYQEGKFNEPDKLREPLAMDPKGNKNKPIGYAQMTMNTLEELKRQATKRGDVKRRQELETYSLANREQSFDAAAEQLTYLYRLMGGSWPKAVAAYNVGPDLRRWFEGANIDPQFFGAPKRDKTTNQPLPTDKWTKEVPGYLRFIFRGATEDPATGDMYAISRQNSTGREIGSIGHQCRPTLGATRRSCIEYN
jgi:hypothetical protein